jgi:hypothetical protein
MIDGFQPLKTGQRRRILQDNRILGEKNKPENVPTHSGFRESEFKIISFKFGAKLHENSGLPNAIK